MDESIYQVINLPSIEKIPAFKALANEWREKVITILRLLLFFAITMGYDAFSEMP